MSDISYKHCSPSQLSMFSTCSANWAYKYVMKLQERFVPNIYLRIGKYLHDSVPKYLENKQWLDPEFLSSELAKEHPPSEGIDMADYKELTKLFTNTVLKYKIEKDSVEQFVKTDQFGIPVVGFIDLINKDGNELIDWKIKGSKQDSISHHHWIQLGFYSMVTGIPNCKNVYFVLEKRKKSDKVSYDEVIYRFKDSDYDIIKRYISKVLAGMRMTETTGNYWPNRGFLCSYCGYQEHCRKEFGEF